MVKKSYERCSKIFKSMENSMQESTAAYFLCYFICNFTNLIHQINRNKSAQIVPITVLVKITVQRTFKKNYL